MYNRQIPCVYPNIKVIFHGIPKNASTTIKNALYILEHGHEFLNINKQWVHKGNHKGGSIYPETQTIKNYKEKDGWKHIAVVRNPYSRFCSFYNDLVLKEAAHRSGIPPFYVDHKINITSMSIDQAIEMIHKYNDDEGDEHFISQSSYIYSDKCKFLRIENLVSDWFSFCRLNNLDLIDLNHYNKSNNELTLTENQKKSIYKRYETDFDKFGYLK